MYAIVKVVYGFLLDDDVSKYHEEYDEYDFDDINDENEHKTKLLVAKHYQKSKKGFIKYNSGDESMTCVFGIEIDSFNQGQCFDITQLKVQPNKKQLEKFQKYYDKLPDELKNYMGKNPKTLIVWASS